MRPRFHRHGFHRADLAAVDHDAPAFRAALLAGLRLAHGHRSNARQGFPAESQGADIFQIVDLGDLAGCMLFEGQQQIVLAHALPVVHHTDHILAAVLDGDQDIGRAGIDGVLHQLLHNG